MSRQSNKKTFQKQTVLRQFALGIVAVCFLLALPRPVIAEIDFVTGSVRTEAGVTVINRAPSIKPPSRLDTSLVVRPKLRPSSRQAVAVTEETTPVLEAAEDALAEIPVEDETVEDVATSSANAELPSQTTAAETSNTEVETPVAERALPHPSHATVKPKLRGVGDQEVAVVPETEDVTAPDNGTASQTVDVETPPLQPPEIVEPETPSFADPKFAGKKPVLRPSDLAQKLAPSTLDLAFSGHRGKLPKRRPSGLVAAAPTPKPEPAIPAKPEEIDPVLTKLQIERDIREREEAARLAGLRSATRLAVPVSRIPGKKSSRFGSTVSKTKANIRKASLSSPSATIDNPSPTDSRGGSTFSKGKISLVGVFGTSSSRRALIRTSNGRYVKVKRGQNVGGWRVSAIGESTVKITRGVRSRTLRLP